MSDDPERRSGHSPIRVNPGQSLDDALRSGLSARDREAALRGALWLIAEFPIPEQDNMIAANMRRIAKEALEP